MSDTNNFRNNLSPRLLNRQLRSIAGGTAEQLLKNKKDIADFGERGTLGGKQASFFAFLNKKGQAKLNNPE